MNLFESARHIKGAWSFVWSTNIAHSIWSARNSCSTVLVGIVLGPAAAGLFKIAMTFFDAAGTPAGLLGKSFYPEVMRLYSRTTRPWLLGVKSGLLAGGIGILVALAVLIVGKPLISLVFGVKYLEAIMIQVMLGAIVISMLGFPQESLLLMAGNSALFSWRKPSPQSATSYCCSCSVICLVCWEQRLLTSVGNVWTWRSR